MQRNSAKIGVGALHALTNLAPLDCLFRRFVFRVPIFYSIATIHKKTLLIHKDQYGTTAVVTGNCGSMPKMQPGQYTRTVYAFLKEQQYKPALEVLHTILHVSPTNRAALSMAAYCYYHQEEYETAAQMYETLQQYYPKVPEYRLHWCQSLYKAGMFAEASRIAVQIEGFAGAVRLLLCAIMYEQEDLIGCRAAIDAFNPSDPSAIINLGCVFFKEGKFASALEQFAEATQMIGYTPELVYSIGACHFKLRDFSAALKVVAEIIELGVREHPELGIGSRSEGVEVRSVGNSAKLKQTALVEAFNLKAAIEVELQNTSEAANALSDMPPRQEHELDPVTLHNQAILSILQGGAGSESAGMDKLVHLLDHPPFPRILLSNLLSMVSKPGMEVPDVAERLLQDHAGAVAIHVPKELRPFYEACAAKARNPQQARAKLDSLAGQHIEALRKLVKRVQDRRWASDQEGAAAGVAEYEEALESYIPVLMTLGSIEWDDRSYHRAQEVLQQSAEFCSDHPTWRLNLAHSILAQEGKLQDAIDLYESIMQHHLGQNNSGSLLNVPPTALANLCVCYVISSQNDVAEDLLRRIEEETSAIQAQGQPVLQHLSLTNLALGTLYCSKGNFEFGIGRVMRSLEPLSANLDSSRWHAAKLCLAAMLDQMAKQMLAIKDATVADLLGFLEDVEAAGNSMPVKGNAGAYKFTIRSEARMIRSMLLRMTD